MESKTIYFDLDGTLARWRKVPVWVTKLPLYFLFLRKEEALVRAFNRLRRLGYDCRILSKSYNKRTNFEKKLWSRIAGIRGPVILVPYGQSKPAYAEEGAVLVDDYSMNLHEWEASGRTGVKFRTSVNGHHGSWKGISVNQNWSTAKMAEVLASAIRAA